MQPKWEKRIKQLGLLMLAAAVVLLQISEQRSETYQQLKTNSGWVGGSWLFGFVILNIGMIMMATSIKLPGPKRKLPRQLIQLARSDPLERDIHILDGMESMQFNIGFVISIIGASTDLFALFVGASQLPTESMLSAMVYLGADVVVVVVVRVLLIRYRNKLRARTLANPV